VVARPAIFKTNHPLTPSLVRRGIPQAQAPREASRGFMASPLRIAAKPRSPATCKAPRPFGLLVRHFFDRMFDNELVSRESHSNTGLAHILAVLAVPGLFIPLFLYPKYTDLASPYPLYYRFSESLWSLPVAARQEVAAAADRFFFVSLVMVILGLVTVLRWESLFPDRRDFTVLGVLPLSQGTVFKAKLASLLLFLGVFALTVNSVPSLTFSVFTLVGRKVSLGYALLSILGHATGVFAASIFVFFLFVALEGILINIFSIRWFARITPYVQVFSIVALLSLFFLSSRLGDMLEGFRKADSPMAYWLPSYWFVGLCELVRGNSDKVLRAWGWRGVEAIGLVVGLALVAYTIGYTRHARRMMEAADNLAVERTRLPAFLTRFLDRWVLRHPLEQACFYFVAQTVTRSNRQRLFLAGYVGVGFALVFQGLMATFARIRWLDSANDALLSIPLILSFFALSGMRFIFSIPSDLSANWVFQLTENTNRQACLAGVRKSMFGLVILPLFLSLLPLYVYLWDLQRALLQTVFGVTLSWILVEVLLLNFQKIPFTCTFLPGKANITMFGFLYFLAFTTYAYTMAAVESWLIVSWDRMALFVALASPILWKLISFRNQLVAESAGFVFEDKREPAVQTLDLSS